MVKNGLELDELLKQAAPYIGGPMTIQIEDIAGQDPVSPGRSEVLYKAELSEEGTHLQLFVNERQFLAIPLFGWPQTGLEASTADQVRLVSHDEAAKLIYRVTLGTGKQTGANGA